MNGLGRLDADAKQLSERDVHALFELVTVSEDFLASDGDVPRHLHVEDGDGDAQDETAEKIQGWKQEARAALAALEPRIESEAGKQTLAEFEAAYGGFIAAADNAVEQSRQETVDGLEDCVGSRSTYADDESVRRSRGSTSSTTGSRTSSPRRRRQARRPRPAPSGCS